jgi:type 1 glutamine amidotransferase
MKFRILCLLLLGNSFCLGQHEWQKPKPLVSKSHIESIIGPVSTTAPSKELNIVWVWGYDKPHKPGNHDYLRIRDLMTGLLNQVSKVTVETAYNFPSKEQFDRADLVAMYLHLSDISSRQYADFKSYIERGGGVVALHETAIIRPASEGEKLVECLGMAWDEGRSQWGALFEDISIENRHEIFKGFPRKLTIVDEFYWDLNRHEDIDVLGAVRTGTPGRSKSPIEEDQFSIETSPVFWTLELGKGRVFGTTAGHNTFSYYDPEFRIVLFRSMAWAVREKPDPFMPLVTEGIVDSRGRVGTTDNMRDWKGKLRAPPTSNP